MRTQVNNQTIQELYLFTINNWNIFMRYTMPIIDNLQKKYHKGTFDSSKALLVFERLAEASAKVYVIAHCTSGDKWYKIFTVAERREVAKQLLHYYLEQIQEEKN